MVRRPRNRKSRPRTRPKRRRELGKHNLVAYYRLIELLISKLDDSIAMRQVEVHLVEAELFRNSSSITADRRSELTKILDQLKFQLYLMRTKSVIAKGQLAECVSPEKSHSLETKGWDPSTIVYFKMREIVSDLTDPELSEDIRINDWVTAKRRTIYPFSPGVESA
jgi:hypothetical protein